MPTVAEQRTAAIQQVERNCAYLSPPALTSGEIETIVDETARAEGWNDATDYEFGAIVVPTVRNGHRYKCIQPGTSDDTEPTWPIVTGAIFSEGDSDPQLIWQEDGPDFANVYDIRRATHKAWLLKATKAAHLYQTRQSASDFHHEQVYEHCLEQAKLWVPINLA